MFPGFPRLVLAWKMAQVEFSVSSLCRGEAFLTWYGPATGSNKRRSIREKPESAGFDNRQDAAYTSIGVVCKYSQLLDFDSESRM
jgi:hypothetical protein